MTAAKTVARPAVRIGPVSMVRRTTTVLALLAMAAVLAVLVCVDVARGDFPISLDVVVDTLFGGGSRAQHFIVVEVRLPRALTGVVVGAALGMSGALTQSVLRNPLASPDLLGITSGAGLAAITVITTAGGGSIGGALAAFGVPLAALAGGFATAAVMYLLAFKRGVEGFRLILIGIGVNAMLLAMISWVIVSARLDDVARAQVWLNGSLDDTDWNRLVPTIVAFAILVVGVAASTTTLAALRFGADTARSLGVRFQTGQAALLFAAVVAAGLATAAAGPVGFVALAAPQIARRLLRSAGEPLVGAALVGAILVVGGDVVARTLLPVPMPVGIVTSAVGGPFLLYLLVRTNRKTTA